MDGGSVDGVTCNGVERVAPADLLVFLDRMREHEAAGGAIEGPSVHDLLSCVGRVQALPELVRSLGKDLDELASRVEKLTPDWARVFALKCVGSARARVRSVEDVFNQNEVDPDVVIALLNGGHLRRVKKD